MILSERPEGRSLRILRPYQMYGTICRVRRFPTNCILSFCYSSFMLYTNEYEVVFHENFLPFFGLDLFYILFINKVNCYIKKHHFVDRRISHFFEAVLSTVHTHLFLYMTQGLLRKKKKKTEKH